MKVIKILSAMAVVLLASCSVPKDITYFQDITGGSEVEVSQPFQVKAQPGDKLRIIVSTQDERLSQMFNLSTGYYNQSSMSSQAAGGALGYTVTSSGTIDFPVIGEVKIGGLYREQIAAEIKRMLQERDLVRDPVVAVDYVNLGVSVLGDVARPGHFSITNDRYTVLEAIADAGDLQITGDRTNVKIIRQEVGKQKVFEVNLNDAESLYASEGFFLQQNDVVYVTPNNKKKREATTNGNTLLTYGFWISMANLMMTAAVVIFK